MWDTPSSNYSRKPKDVVDGICTLLDKKQVRMDLNNDNYTMLLFISPNFVYSM